MAILQIKLLTTPYEIYSTRQVVHMTSRSESQINQKMKMLGDDGETQLDYCRPFPYTKAAEHINTGPKYIIANEKFDKFVQYCRKHKLET